MNEIVCAGRDGRIVAYHFNDAGCGVLHTEPIGGKYDVFVDAWTCDAWPAGNRIAYTLDAAGNRTAEQVFDPDGTLARTRSQVFDALGRLVERIEG